MGILKNKIAIITGGSQGIGEAISKRFYNEGAKVIIIDIDERAYLNNFSNKYKEIKFFKVDLKSTSELLKIKNFIADNYKNINILVNNAAVLDARKIDDFDIFHFNNILNNNLSTTLNTVQTFLELLKSDSCYNKILNISSIMGFMGSKESVPYSTAKSGIINLTKCLAAELGIHNICANSISPGFIDTRMALLPDGSGHEYDTTMFQDVYLKHSRIPLNRTGFASDIEGPSVFLCGSDSDYITGHNLVVDGGISTVL